MSDTLTLTCASCEAEFTVPRGPGRRPKRCEDCNPALRARRERAAAVQAHALPGDTRQVAGLRADLAERAATIRTLNVANARYRERLDASRAAPDHLAVVHAELDQVKAELAQAREDLKATKQGRGTAIDQKARESLRDGDPRAVLARAVHRLTDATGPADTAIALLHISAIAGAWARRLGAELTD